MTIAPEQIFAKKQELQQQLDALEQELVRAVDLQKTADNVETVAKSIMEYQRVIREIEDRQHVFSLLSSPPESLRSPFVKAQFFSFIVAAETVGPELVDFLTDGYVQQLRLDLQSDEEWTTDLIQAEYKEYVLPGKIIGEQFVQINGLIDEMNRYCARSNAEHNPATASEVLRYAFEISFSSDIRLDPTIHALREVAFPALSQEDRSLLLDGVEERLAIIRFEQARQQQIAMDQAVQILADREKEPK